jgi:uncharacterized protein YjbI with pentapeptide repeats
LWWRLPKRQVDRLSVKIRDAKARADVEDNFRKTIGQLLGGAVVLAGAGLAYLQFTQQQEASHELLISNQVSKGFEQLGSDKVVVELGGIYALEGVMNTSEQYHQPILDALCAFVRDHTKDGSKIGDQSPETEIQAALIVIGRRRSYGSEIVDLSGVNIPGASLRLLDITATENSISITDPGRHRAQLRVARLNGANLNRVDFYSADLTLADLRGANLSGANLQRASLYGANLDGARLNGANPIFANLTMASLSHADLGGADLSGVTLSKTQLDKACGTDAKLPPGLTLKPCAPH